MEIDLGLNDASSASDFIADFIRSHAEQSGRRRAVVALSGGVDSAVTAALAVRALGPKHVVSHTLPDGRVTPKSDVEDAHRVADALGIRCRRISIHDALESLEITFKGAGLTGDAVSWGNAKARLRMIATYFVAHVEGGLVLGTGNKSEILIGYFSKYGDAGADLLPLGRLYKTQVQELARHLQLPVRVIEKPPSAGLWEGQTDEGELGLSYRELDRILVCLHDRSMAVDETATALDVDRHQVAEVVERIRASAHKRAMPPMPDDD